MHFKEDTDIDEIVRKYPDDQYAAWAIDAIFNHPYTRA